MTKPVYIDQEKLRNGQHDGVLMRSIVKNIVMDRFSSQHFDLSIFESLGKLEQDELDEFNAVVAYLYWTDHINMEDIALSVNEKVDDIKRVIYALSKQNKDILRQELSVRYNIKGQESVFGKVV